jgi:dTMP kinase
MDWVIAANKLSADLLRPDLTIFIDVNPAVSMARINANRSVTELYENLENLEKVRQNYFQAFDKLKDEENIFIVDGSSDPEIVSESIWEKITSML